MEEAKLGELSAYDQTNATNKYFLMKLESPEPNRWLWFPTNKSWRIVWVRYGAIRPPYVSIMLGDLVGFQIRRLHVFVIDVWPYVQLSRQ